MSEFSGAGFTSRIRETNFGYDDVRRLTSVGFDNGGSGSVDETVSYEYDAGGLRTKLTMPGNLNVTYGYDARGQLVSLTDWSGQPSRMAYDNVGRHVLTERANGLRSQYLHDAGNRLRRLRHTAGGKTLAEFAYEVDKRGNRTQAREVLLHPATTNDTTIAYNDKGIVTGGTWTAVSNFKQTTEFSATLKLIFVGENRRNGSGVLGDALRLTIGTGPDHSIFDIYIDGSLWESIDAYAAVAAERNIDLEVNSDGVHLLELRNRAERHKLSTGYNLRYKQLVVKDKAYTTHTIGYTYDKLSRLREARYGNSLNVNAPDVDLLRRYQYAFDLAGNRTQQSIALNGAAPTVTNYSYNAANQLTNAGAATLTYDNNGNLTSYTWDRANRMIGGGGATYAYDGAGNRIRQTVGVTVTNYLLDVQPGLAVVLAATTGANTDRYLHSLRGIHAQRDAANNWEWLVQDGLGSVRGVADNTAAALWSGSYEPFGVAFGSVGTQQTVYGFTGEAALGAGGLIDLRARKYNPAVGIFTSLDPFEGMMQRPMSLNGYSWVEGNSPNAVDPSGMVYELPDRWNRCGSTKFDMSSHYGKLLGNGIPGYQGDSLSSEFVLCGLFDTNGSFVTYGTTAGQFAVGERLLFNVTDDVANFANQAASGITLVGGIVGAACQAGRGDNARALFTLGLTGLSILGGAPGTLIAAFITLVDHLNTAFPDVPRIDPQNSSIPNSSGICRGARDSAFFGSTTNENDLILDTFHRRLGLPSEVYLGLSRPSYNPTNAQGPIPAILADQSFQQNVRSLYSLSDYNQALYVVRAIEESMATTPSVANFYRDAFLNHPQLLDTIICRTYALELGFLPEQGA